MMHFVNFLSLYELNNYLVVYKLKFCSLEIILAKNIVLMFLTVSVIIVIMLFFCFFYETFKFYLKSTKLNVLTKDFFQPVIFSLILDIQVENSDFYLNNSLVKREYLILLVFLLVALVLTLVIIGASYFLSKQNPELEKLSAYECGFEPYEDARHVFDIKFCVIAILFIIFDIEVMFLIPWCVSLSKLDLLGFWSMIDFLIELGVGFFYVWYVKALDWD